MQRSDAGSVVYLFRLMHRHIGGSPVDFMLFTSKKTKNPTICENAARTDN